MGNWYERRINESYTVDNELEMTNNQLKLINEWCKEKT